MKKNKQTKSKKGFSLMELLVVFSIMAIMVAISIKMSQNSKGNEDLIVATREFTLALRQAQNNALGGKLPIAGNATTFACGYALGYSFNSKKDYRLGYVEKTLATQCGNGSDMTMGNTVTLKGDVEFEAPGSPNSLYFTIPFGAIYFDNSYNDSNPKMSLGSPLTPGSAPIAITLKSPSVAKMRADVCIYPAGKIEEKPLRNIDVAAAPSC